MSDAFPTSRPTSAQLDLEHHIIAQVSQLDPDGTGGTLLRAIKAGLTVDYFQDERCAEFFRVLSELPTDENFDPYAAVLKLRGSGQFDDCEIDTLTEVTKRKVNVASIGENVRHLRESCAKRTADALQHRAELHLADVKLDPANRAKAIELLKEAEEAQDGVGTQGDAIFTPLDEILNGDFAPELPTIGQIESGGALLYAGRLNEIHGEPSVGKTNISLAIVASVLAENRNVIFADPEDNAQAITRRLLAFGANPEAVRNHFHYLHDPGAKEIRAALAWTKKNPVALIDFDGLAELLAGQGIPEKDETGILSFFREFVRPFADQGAAVLLSDHVVKNAETRAQWSRGSGAKMGRYDGASYEVSLIRAYDPHTPGAIKMKVSKDRNGGVGPRGTIAAEIHFTPDGENGTIVDIRKPEPKGEFTPTAIMEKVSKAIEANPQISLRQLRELGKAEYVRQAIEKLEAQSFIQIERPGAGLPNRYQITTPYRENQGHDKSIF